MQHTMYRQYSRVKYHFSTSTTCKWSYSDPDHLKPTLVDSNGNLLRRRFQMTVSVGHGES